MFDFCKKCRDKSFIVNKKYYLCNSCNKDRLLSISTITLKKKESVTDRRKPIKKQRIKQVSRKESRNKKELKQTYAIIDDIRERRCEGCDQKEFLSHAHLISQRNKKYQNEEKNIVYHCMERILPDKYGTMGCHQRWESGQWDKIITLNNYKEHLSYIKERDPIKYRKIILSKDE